MLIPLLLVLTVFSGGDAIISDNVMIVIHDEIDVFIGDSELVPKIARISNDIIRVFGYVDGNAAYVIYEDGQIKTKIWADSGVQRIIEPAQTTPLF